eukprot:439039_1
MATEKKEEEILNESVSDLVNSLNSQINELQSWLKCRHTKINSDDKDELIQIEKRITDLESKVCIMDENICKEEESLVFIERMSECLDLQNNKISYIIDHLPINLPNISNNYKLPSNALSLIINKSMSSSITPSNTHIQQQQQQHKKSNKRKTISSLINDPRAIKRRKINENNIGKPKTKKEIPQIEIVGKDEFNNVPKYVKSRLTQIRLNESINEFNKILILKYSLLQMNPSKMGKNQFDLHEKYIKQTNETKYLHWLNHDDFKDSKNFTFDQTGKAIFNVMRHLKRIKMISGKKPKYAVL